MVVLLVASGPLGAPTTQPADAPIDVARRTMGALLPAGSPALPDALHAALEGGAGPSSAPASTQTQASQLAQQRHVKVESFDSSSLDALFYSSSIAPPRRITSVAAAAEQRNASLAVAQYASPISYQRSLELPASLVRRWAGRWGYDYWLQTEPFRAYARGDSPIWQKLPLIVQLCRAGYARVAFVDYDAFVLREDLRIEPFFDGEGARASDAPSADVTYGALNAPFFTALGYKQATEARPQLNAGVILVRSSEWAMGFFERIMTDGSCRTHVMNAEEICLNNAAERETEPDRFAFAPYGRLQCDPVMGKLVGWMHELKLNEQQDRCETPLFYHAMGSDMQKRGGSEVAAAVSTRLAAAPQMAPYTSVDAALSDVCAAPPQPPHAAGSNASSNDADVQPLCDFCSLLDHPHRCPGGEEYPWHATARAIPGLASVIPGALSKHLFEPDEDDLYPAGKNDSRAEDSGVAGGGAGGEAAAMLAQAAHTPERPDDLTAQRGLASLSSSDSSDAKQQHSSAKCGSTGAPFKVQVLIDVDDTFTSSGGSMGGCDDRLERGTLYPGAAQFFRELARGPALGSGKGVLTPALLTSRPLSWGLEDLGAALLETDTGINDGSFTDYGDPDARLSAWRLNMAGSMLGTFGDLVSNQAMGSTKAAHAEAFVAEHGTATCVIFVGDDGLGDCLAARRMQRAIKHGGAEYGVLALFTHTLPTASCPRKEPCDAGDGLSWQDGQAPNVAFESYVDAADKAEAMGLISAEGRGRVHAAILRSGNKTATAGTSGLLDTVSRTVTTVTNEVASRLAAPGAYTTGMATPLLPSWLPAEPRGVVLVANNQELDASAPWANLSHDCLVVRFNDCRTSWPSDAANEVLFTRWAGAVYTGEAGSLATCARKGLSERKLRVGGPNQDVPELYLDPISGAVKQVTENGWLQGLTNETLTGSAWTHLPSAALLSASSLSTGAIAALTLRARFPDPTPMILAGFSGVDPIVMGINGHPFEKEQQMLRTMPNTHVLPTVADVDSWSGVCR